MRICAWCDREIGSVSATVRGIPATSWGMCPDCLSKRLDALEAAPPEAPYELLHPLDLSRPKAASEPDEEV